MAARLAAQNSRSSLFRDDLPSSILSASPPLSDTLIRLENVSKWYVLGDRATGSARYHTFCDAVIRSGLPVETIVCGPNCRCR